MYVFIGFRTSKTWDDTRMTSSHREVRDWLNVLYASPYRLELGVELPDRIRLLSNKISAGVASREITSSDVAYSWSKGLPTIESGICWCCRVASRVC